MDFFLVFGVAGIAAAITGVVNWLNIRIKPSKREFLALGGKNFAQLQQQEIESGRKPIPKEIQEEIDMTPGWWDSMYHKMLEKTGADSIAVPYEPEYIEEHSANGNVVLLSVTPEPPPVLLDCTCARCTQARALIHIEDHKRLKHRLTRKLG